MNFNDEHLDRLEKMFEDRWEDFVRGNGQPSDTWLNFCDKHDIVQIVQEEVRWWFNHNHDHVVVGNPEAVNFGAVNHIAVPKEFAEKCLILGFVPE